MIEWRTWWAESQLKPKAGTVSFVGKNIIQPMSVSAQLSASGKTLVVRIVNHGAPTSASLSLEGFKGTGLLATAVTMASDDLAAENTAADVGHVAPTVLHGCAVLGGHVELQLPGKSYTVVTMLQSA
jgi:alpha-L-arabinofuranosidase